MYKVSKFKEYWAVWEDDSRLICITVYRKGAETLRAHLEEKDQTIHRLHQVIINELGIDYIYASCGQ